MSDNSKTSSSAREREIFLTALEQPPADRAAFLDKACGNDTALRGRIHELLREQEQMAGFLETPAMSGALPRSAKGQSGPGGTELIAFVTEKPGDRIGRYKLLQKIGEGGCGVVYMAEQEEPVRRRVALKIIKLGMDTRSVIARFEAERQALAMMDHPNIARVFDAGATETGRPFFVMELVRGIRITEYCDQNNLSTEERLKLFVQACQAIQHAHHKGVIHRDIKPSNILVTLHDGVPVPKVIDFGIAKATEQRLTEKTLFTEFTTFIGTPAYMSPEQAEMSGLDIDTRADVYALGVLLYELLTGKTPFDPETLLRVGLDECRRTIREKEPARPSTRLATMIGAELTTTARQRRTDAIKLVHSLRGDLDWIVMKSLEKDRTRRYETVSALAHDVHRYLESEPVLARPPSNIYRLRKLVRRHRGAVAAAAAIFVTLVTGIALSAWQAVRATQAEHRAQSAQRQEIDLRRQAEQEQIRAETEKASARLNEYVADINLAQRSLKDGNYGRAVQLLNKHQPVPGEPDLRGFEWRHLWHEAQGDEHLTLPKQPHDVRAVAFSNSGDLVAVGGKEQFTVYNARTRAIVKTVPKGGISMTFLPDGNRLLTASERTVRIWNMTDWSEEKSWPNEFSPIALSRDSSQLAILNRNGVRLFDTTTSGNLRLIERASGPVVFSPDGKTLATDSEKGITLWALDGTRAEVTLVNSTNLFRRIPGPQIDRALTFSPDGKFVIAARNVLSDRGVFILSIWDAVTGKEIGQMPEASEPEHTGVISSITFSPDGRLLATASMDHSIRFWDFAQRRRIAALHGHLSEVWTLAFSPDSKTLMSGSRDGSVNLWEAQPQKVSKQKEDLLAGWTPLGFSKDSRRLAALNREGTVAFINLVTSEPEQEFQLDVPRFNAPHPRPRISVAVSEDFRTIVQNLEGAGIKLRDTETGDSTTLKTPERHIDSVELSPDGRQLISSGGAWDRATRWWDLRAGTNFAMNTEAFRFSFSPDGRTLVGGGRGSVELWNAQKHSLITNWVVDVPPPPLPFANAFSADGAMLALGGSDDAIRVYETASGKLLGTFIGHKQSVFSLAFSPDGTTLASAGDDSTLRLWNLTTQQELLVDRRLGGALREVMFSPDGQFLAAGSSMSSSAGGIRFYRAPRVDTPRPTPRG